MRRHVSLLHFLSPALRRLPQLLLPSLRFQLRLRMQLAMRRRWPVRYYWPVRLHSNRRAGAHDYRHGRLFHRRIPDVR
jgi:hypothetical protein